MSDELAVATRPQEVKPLFDAMKRIFDFGAGIVLLVVFSPIILALAYLVRRGSAGPIFYRQVRIGRSNRPFLIYKFRTMFADADQQGPQITSSDDSRVTPLGRRLRDLKLDELPQLINVVTGDMSLVGPRPQVPRFVNEFRPDQRPIVLAVRPGITGPTQLQFRNEETLLEGQPDRERYYIQELLPIKCDMDVEYVRNRSISYDLRVLTETTMLLVRGTLIRLFRRAPEPQGLPRTAEKIRDKVAES